MGWEEHGFGTGTSWGSVGVPGNRVHRGESVESPFPMQAVPGSSFEVIPKGKTGKWHLIVDLSSPDLCM